MLKELLYKILLFIVIPLTLFFIVLQIVDKNAETFSDYLHPLLSLNKSEEDEEVLPLIKIQNQNTNAVVANVLVPPAETTQNEPIQESQDDDINKIPLEFLDQTFSNEDILQDKLNKLPPEFKVTPDLKYRISFWFDIYSKYSSHFSIIHDEDRPWIIYKIVDLRDIYDGPGNIFNKDIKDKDRVKKESELVRKTLLSLSRKKSFDNLTPEEFKYFKLLEEIPGERKKVFRQAAHSFRQQRGQKDFFRKGIISSSKYINEMEEVFARYDLPPELVRLPLVESSFNEEAISKVGASGIWQFMLGTSKKFLKVDSKFDERNSPIKATEGAAKLFLSNYRILKSWPLTITAYNHGAGGLIKASKILKTANLAEIIKNYRSKNFSFASQNFYSEFIAALYVEKYQEEIFGPLTKHPPLAADSFQLKKSMRVKEIADIAGITMEEIKLHNPDLRKRILMRNPFLPIGYKIRLPLGRSAALEIYTQKKLSRRNSS